MLRIGDFARLNKVSIKTLRYYDEIGLFKPERVEEQTGYRYYSASQIPRLHRILFLREVGFPLEQIAAMAGDDLDIGTAVGLLENRARDIRESIAEAEGRLAKLHSFIEQIKQEGDAQMPVFDVIVKEVDTLKVASIQEQVEDYGKQGALWTELLQHMTDHQIKIAAPCIAIYYQAEDQGDTVNLEVAAYVTAEPPETDRVKIRELPSVAKMACVAVKGNHEVVAAAYTAVQKWMEASQCDIAGPVREVHLVGYWSNPNPDEHITEIQIPIAQKTSA